MTPVQRKAAFGFALGLAAVAVAVVIFLFVRSDDRSPAVTARNQVLAGSGLVVKAQGGQAPARRQAAAGSNGPVIPQTALGSFSGRSFGSGMDVSIAVAPIGAGPVQSSSNDTARHAWSTMKVPVLVTLIGLVGGSDRLSSTQRANAEAALTQSDNDAAKALFADVESRTGGSIESASLAIQRKLRQAGDSETVVNTVPPAGGFTTFGQTLWSAGKATVFYRALAAGCLLPRSSSDYVISLMRNVTSGQRWGIGAAGFSVPTAFKGGWGPEPNGGYIVRQSGIVGSGDSAYAVTILGVPGSGGISYEGGSPAVTAAASWIRAHARPGRHSRFSCPG